MSSSGGRIDTVMQEDRLFPPSKEFSQQARIGSLAEYEKMWESARRDLPAFWAKYAHELHWFEPFSTVLEWNELLLGYVEQTT